MLYNLQKNLLSVILNNDDGSTNEGSSRKIFLSRLRKYVMENSLEHRVSPQLKFEGNRKQNIFFWSKKRNNSSWFPIRLIKKILIEWENNCLLSLS